MYASINRKNGRRKKETMIEVREGGGREHENKDRRNSAFYSTAVNNATLTININMLRK
jgi:hypothetical protein